MVRLLYTLPDELRNKSIYIWNIDKDSITEFTKLAVRQINVKGFVAQESLYIGKLYMNRPVVGIETVIQDEEAIVILSGKCDRSRIPVEIDQKAFWLSDLIQIDDRLKEKRVFIYGAGIGGKKIYAELKNSHIEPEGFCVTCKKENRLEDKEIWQIDEIEQGEDKAFIISSLHDNTKQQIVDILDEFGADIYIRDFFDDYTIFVTSLFQSVHKAWQEKRKVYIYTRTLGGYLKLIKATLEIYGIQISGYVCKGALEESGIRDVYELAYEEIEDIYVLVNDLDMIERKEQLEAYDILESIGFSLEEFNYAGFHQTTSNDWHAQIQMVPDPFVGWSMIYGKDNLPGINVIGNENENDIRIVVLGGSTSTEGILRPVSWVKRLHQKLVSQGLAVTIYDCAGPDEDVLQELLRLIRDVKHLKPQYIISMSGVNNQIHRIEHVENKANLKHMVEWYDTLAPDALCVNGIPVRESAFAYWLRIQKIIKVTAEIYGSRYYSFLQPIKAAKDDLSIFERSIHFTGDTYNEGASFRLESREDDFYKNLLFIFDEKEGMFIDSCHYSEEANKILAQIVYEELSKDLFDTV